MSGDKFLSQKRVLFLGYEHYDYSAKIRGALIAAGATLSYFPVWKYGTILEKLVHVCLRKLSTKLFQKYNDAYGRDILKRVRGNRYDFVLVIQGFQLPDEFYVELRRLNPNAVFLNYHWDPLVQTVYNNNYLDKAKFFDKVYSFDREDCQTHPCLSYLPLFYTEEYEQLRRDSSAVQQDIDLLFIGSLCEFRRYRYVRQIERLCATHGIRFFCYMRVSKRFYISHLLRGQVLSGVHFKPLTRSHIIDYYRRATTIIDLPHLYQSGLTVRVFEVLGSGKRLVTGNSHIAQEPFYNPDSISIIDAEEPSLDVSFIKGPPSKWDSRIEECSIKNWLRRLFGVGLPVRHDQLDGRQDNAQQAIIRPTRESASRAEQLPQPG